MERKYRLHPEVAKALFTEGSDATEEIEKFRKSKVKKKRSVFADSISDYPDAVSNNAKRGIELNEKVNNKCATQVGKVRAQQLAQREPISIDTVKRMYSYLSRAEEYYDESDTKACGTISYLLWGGKAGLRWANSKLKELDLSLSELSEMNKAEAADILIERGEFESDLLNDYELIDAREVDYDLEDKRNSLWNFATAKVPSSKPQAESIEDNAVIKVRYVYAPDKNRAQPENSRDFCSKMVNAGRVYRKEDIEFASARAVNPGWGPNGSDTYDLWLYKGGGNCSHFWERRTYLRRNNKRVSVNQARRIIQQAGEQPMKRNDRRVAQRPRDMINKGFLPGNPQGQ